jgi:hypothetical protein
MTKKEYLQQSDVPVHPVIVGRTVSNWARLERIIKNGFPEQYAKATELM